MPNFCLRVSIKSYNVYPFDFKAQIFSCPCLVLFFFSFIGILYTKHARGDAAPGKFVTGDPDLKR